VPIADNPYSDELSLTRWNYAILISLYLVERCDQPKDVHLRLSADQRQCPLCSVPSPNASSQRTLSQYRDLLAKATLNKYRQSSTAGCWDRNCL